MSPARIALFLTIVIGITVGLHYYVWTRVIRDAAWPGAWPRVGTAVFTALALALPLGMVGMRFLPRKLVALPMWVAFSWMGLMFFLLVILLPADLFRGLYALVARLIGRPPADPARREFIGRALAASAGAGALTLGIVSLITALRPLRVKRVTVELPRLPQALSGFTIVQLSDIHVGPTIGREFIEEMVAKTNALSPDVVAITGDLVDGSVAELGAFVEPLRNLRARHGVYFVTGNHEYYSGADEWIALLNSLGVRVLRNERVAIEHQGAWLDIAGVDDWTAHQFGNGHGRDLPRALAGRDDARPVVLMAHQPKAVEEADQHGVDLVLSGHTHGGQMMPFNYLVKLQQPYVVGLHTHGRARLYVSPGTGYWGPPMRLGVPAEITRLELVAPRA